MGAEGMTEFSYTVRTWNDGPTRPGQRVPAGRLVRIEAEVILPADASREEVMEWIKYQMGWGSIANSNPLSGTDLEVHGEPVLTDTGMTTDRLRVREDALEQVRRAHYARQERTPMTTTESDV